jgi:hypothetical protein
VLRNARPTGVERRTWPAIWDTQSEQDSRYNSAFSYDDVEPVGSQIHRPAVAGLPEVQIHNPHAFGLSRPPSGFDRFRSGLSDEL